MSEVLRPIDTTGYSPPASLSAGAAPQLAWLRIADLVVDDSYQRRITKAGRQAVKAIAAAFEWSQFSPVIVAPVTAGRYAIIDGQHRTTAAAVCGYDSVPCEIVKVDRRLQAKAFAAINGRVQRITTMQVFHAAKEAREDWALAVDQVATAAGVTVLRYPIGASVPDRPPHSTMAVVVLRRLVERHGAHLVGLMLRCVVQSALGDDPGALGHMWMVAIASVLAERPPLLEGHDARLIAFFDELDAGAAVKGAQAAKGHGVSVTEQLAIRLRALLDTAFPSISKKAA